MRGFTILTLTVAVMVGWLVIRDGYTLVGAVLVGLSVVGIVAHIWIGNVPGVNVPPDIVEVDEPTAIRESMMQTFLDASPPGRWRQLRRKCRHVELWEPLCDDCTLLLLRTDCHECAVETDQPVSLVGCPNCPPVRP